MTTTTRTAAKNLTAADFAAALDWRERNLPARLTALGHTEECSRCGGSGHYSYNQMTGTVCFRCNGARRTLKPLTAKLLETVKAEVAAGKLDAYLARCQAAAAARAELAPMLARAEAACKFQNDRYTAWSRSHGRDDEREFMFASQEMANCLFFGARSARLDRASGLNGYSIKDLIDGAGRKVDVFQARAEVLWRVEMMELMDREVRALCAD